MSDVYRLQVILTDAPVAISRTIQLPASISLNQLHLVLQEVMGWQNSHLYQFEKDGQIWTHPGFLMDDFWDEWEQIEDTEVALCDVLTEVGQTLGYLYDFGDHWQHTVQLIAKATGELNPNQTILLVDAQGACPPEDVGGIPGYEQMLLAFESGDEEQIAEYLNWLGLECWDPLDAQTPTLAKRIHALNQQFALTQRARQLDWQVKADAHISDLPIMQLLQPMFALLYASPLSLTNKGNMPLKLVQAMFTIEQSLPGWQKYRFKRGKINSEQDSTVIWTCRQIAQKAGLIKVQANKIQLTKAGEKLVLAQDHLKIYQKLLQSAVGKFNWTNLDNYPHFSYVQVGFMPLLDYVLKHPKGELSSDELIPLLQRWFPELDIETHGDYLEDAFGYRVELMGELFGLCTVSEQPSNEYYPFQRRFQVMLLPMARKLLSFSAPVPALELSAEV